MIEKVGNVIVNVDDYQVAVKIAEARSDEVYEPLNVCVEVCGHRKWGSTIDGNFGGTLERSKSPYSRCKGKESWIETRIRDQMLDGKQARLNESDVTLEIGKEDQGPVLRPVLLCIQ